MRHGRASEDSCQLYTFGHAHAFSAVTGHGVGYLVSDDRGQTALILGDSQNACVDADFAAWQAEGIGLWTVEENEFPLCIGQVGHGGNPSPHLFEQSLLGGILADGCLFLEGFEGAEAEGHLLAGPGHHELFSTGHRLSHAASRDESQAQKQVLARLQALGYHGFMRESQ